MKQYILIIIITIIRYIISYIINTTGKIFYTKNVSSKNIFDIGWEYLPNLSGNTVLMYLLYIIAFIVPLLYNINIVTEYSQYITFLLIIQYIFPLLTILPKYKDCNDSNYGIKEFLLGDCYNKLFSIYLASFMIFTLILHRTYKYNLYILIILNIIYALFLVMLKINYTIDVLITFIVVIIVYQNNFKINLLNK